ncbi:hypothetical protein [Streptomyces endophyticus]|uniref:Uncharacterized protein n=1 Tax=Streptomyces endophyticus TaxID=714166 RepID=A0ABU6FDJ9_9ACTN|nr:hypothetical protein [Streptomyces endophyticus]MEB8342114.1 hypothetical protein [Streptomyces endophyticus]
MPPWYRKHRHPGRPDTQHPERPDLSRIAILEHDLLGIEPEPGTPAAYAAALARPLDQDACPHEDAMDVIPLGQGRSTGMCAGCDIDVVETDEGLWDSP